jgi:hypothetical protein
MTAPPNQAQARSRGESVTADRAQGIAVDSGEPRDGIFDFRHEEIARAQLAKHFRKSARPQGVQLGHVAFEPSIAHISRDHQAASVLAATDDFCERIPCRNTGMRVSLDTHQAVRSHVSDGVELKTKAPHLAGLGAFVISDVTPTLAPRQPDYQAGNVP